jgi:hypothetical protein
MNEQSFTTRNRTLLFVLAAAGIFVAGCLTGYRFNSLYRLWSAPARPRIPQMAIVDRDGSTNASRLRSELRSVDSVEVSEYADRVMAQRDLAENKIDILLCIGPDFHRRVDELDLADVLMSPHGRLDGTLESLDIEVETGTRVAGGSETVETLIYGFAVRSISSQVLERTEPVLARKLAAKVSRNRRQMDKPR